MFINGHVVEDKVVRITDFGAFVELADGIEELIHVSEFDDQEWGDKAELTLDETIRMRVIKLTPSELKIGLRVRAPSKGNFGADWRSYASSEPPEVRLGRSVQAVDVVRPWRRCCPIRGAAVTAESRGTWTGAA